ncbi:MAG: hypothetical protein NC184_06245 [Roseburia sp.]|nr:hypothetical protein [Roseburia sp.]
MSEYNPYKEEYKRPLGADMVSSEKGDAPDTTASENATEPKNEHAPEKTAPETTVPVRTVDKVVSLTYASVLLAFHLLTIVLLLCGCVRFNGNNINIIYAFKLIFNIFRTTKGTVYMSLIGGAMGAGFFVCVVFGVIFAVRSVRMFTALVKNRNKAHEDCRINYGMIKKMFDLSINIFVGTVIFTAVADLLSVNELSGMMIALLVCGGIVFVAQRAVYYIYKFDEFVPVRFIFDTLGNAVLYVLLALTVGFLNNAAGKDLFYGAQKMFNGNVFGGSVSSATYSLYVSVLEPALFVAIAIVMLVITVCSVRGTFAVEAERRSKVKAALILLAITTVMHLIFRVFIASGVKSFDISLLSSWLKRISLTYIPLLLIAVAMLIRSLSFGIAIGKGGSKPSAAPKEQNIPQ